MLKNKFLIGFLLFSAVFLSGCSFVDIKNRAGDFWDKSKDRIGEVVGPADENLNPDFEKTNEAALEVETVSEIDQYLKENFRKVFGAAKIVETGQLRSTPFTFQYVMKNRVKPENLEVLSTKFLATGSFAKDDAPIVQDEKSSIGQFGLYHNFGGRRYVLAFLFDYEKQLVWVNIY